MLKNKKRIAITGLLIVFIFLLLPKRSFASVGYIKNFQSDININSNGTIDITEYIDYDFGTEGTERHGILREIPNVKTNEDGKKYKLDIKIDKVTDQNGNEIKYSVSKESNKLKIKIGDPNVLVSGEKSYVIKYSVSGAITYFTDHDELYWNLSGNSWEVPINEFGAEIKLPEGADQSNTKLVCYDGYEGSTSQNCSILFSDGKIIVKSEKILSPGEGVTAAIYIPKGLVAVIEPVEDKIGWLLVLAKIFVYGGLSIWYLFLPIKKIVDYLKDRSFTKKNARIVSAWFEPPKYDDGRVFTPAETGFILDKSVDHKELTATIISLAQRGFLKIKEDEKNHFTFVKLKDVESPELRKFEKEVMLAIFEKGDEVKDESLKTSTSLFSKIKKFNKYVEEEVVNQGMFEKKPSEEREKDMLLLSLGFFTMNFFLGIVLIILAGKGVKRTKKGIEKYSEAKSLFNFLMSQDEQLNFQSKNQMFFEKLLPYAAAFGVEKVWAQRFKDITIVKPDWYEGNNFTTTAFVSSMTRNIGGSMKSAYSSGMSTTRSSTGFSSGFSGGHSGGGGGGGGGGSW